MKKLIIKLSVNGHGDCVGLDPRRIAVIYGDTIFSTSKTFGDWGAVVDIDSLPSWGDIANDTEYYLGSVTFTPERNKNRAVERIFASYERGYYYLFPMENIEVLSVE